MKTRVGAKVGVVQPQGVPNKMEYCPKIPAAFPYLNCITVNIVKSLWCKTSPICGCDK
jgi:hypothetical protein